MDFNCNTWWDRYKHNDFLKVLLALKLFLNTCYVWPNIFRYSLSTILPWILTATNLYQTVMLSTPNAPNGLRLEILNKLNEKIKQKITHIYIYKWWK